MRRIWQHLGMPGRRGNFPDNTLLILHVHDLTSSGGQNSKGKIPVVKHMTDQITSASQCSQPPAPSQSTSSLGSFGVLATGTPLGTGYCSMDEKRRFPVWVHASFYAGPDDDLTTATSTMTAGHSAQDIKSGVPIKCRAISNLLSDRKLEPCARNVATIVNPARSGLWDEKGEFCKANFQRLITFAVQQDGQLLVTLDAFQRYLDTVWNERRNCLYKSTDVDGVATRLGYVIPVSWKAVTQGSIKELIEYYSDAEYKAGPGKRPVKAITIETLRLFYTQPNVIANERQVACASARGTPGIGRCQSNCPGNVRRGTE